MKELWHIVSKLHHFYLSSAFFLFDSGFLKINETEIVLKTAHFKYFGLSDMRSVIYRIEFGSDNLFFKS